MANMSKFRHSLIYLKIKLSIIALLPLGIYLLPRELILSGEHSICLFKLIFHHECWGCGMTRAFVSLAYLDFEGAWQYNHLVVIVAPLMLYLWGKWVVTTYKNLKQLDRTQQYAKNI